jgi:N-formylglutamate amidohydrolase
MVRRTYVASLWFALFCVPIAYSQEQSTPAKSAETNRGQRTAVSLEQMVIVEEGQLPILISAPHGGLLKIPNVDPRQGVGMEKGPSGFFAGRDGGTEELAKDVIEAIEMQLGRKPYSVISSVDRKYLDPNRPPEIAYEDVDAKPVYDRYHDSMLSHCRSILNEYHSGLLLDIHGQGSKRDTVFRGTSNGKTVSRIREQFGDSAHTGESSLFGLLKEQGWTVFPDPYDGKEQSGFTGGHIVRTYGSHQASGIDAVQLEFGAEYRTKANRKKIAEQLATAVAQYAKLYLRMPEAR